MSWLKHRVHSRCAEIPPPPGYCCMATQWSPNLVWARSVSCMNKSTQWWDKLEWSEFTHVEPKRWDTYGCRCHATTLCLSTLLIMRHAWTKKINCVWRDSRDLSISITYFITCRHAMYAERDIVLANPSVSPFVCPMPLLCLNVYLGPCLLTNKCKKKL